MAKREKLTEEERKQRHRESSRQYYERNKEAHKARCRDWQKRNPDKCTKYKRRWNAKNPDKVKSADQRKYERFRRWLDGIKSERGCAVCEESRAPCLDFHHRDPKTKSFWIGSKNAGYDNVLEEIAKCDVLCANCHRVLHHGDGAAS